MGFFTNRTQMTGQRATDERRQLVVGADEPRTFQRIRPLAGRPQESGPLFAAFEGPPPEDAQQEGAMTEQELSDFLCPAPGLLPRGVAVALPAPVHRPAAPMTFDITAKGRELARHYEAEDADVGPAPVSFEAYCRMVLHQASRVGASPRRSSTKHSPICLLRSEMRRMLKEAFTSGQVLPLLGPSGQWQIALERLAARHPQDRFCSPHAFRVQQPRRSVL